MSVYLKYIILIFCLFSRNSCLSGGYGYYENLSAAFYTDATLLLDSIKDKADKEDYLKRIVFSSFVYYVSTEQGHIHSSATVDKSISYFHKHSVSHYPDLAYVFKDPLGRGKDLQKDGRLISKTVINGDLSNDEYLGYIEGYSKLLKTGERVKK